MRSPTFSVRIRNIAAACAVAFLYAPAAAFAQGTGGPDLGLGFATAIGLTTTDIRTTISRIISYFLGFLGIIAVCIMLYAGFLWMTAGGSEEKVSTAKRWMINGTIGLVIIMSAFAITQFIFRAVEEGAGGGTGGCPPGLTCTPGGIGGGGGGGGFRVDGTTPAGAGPGNGGWPKNYAITVSFNSAVADGSVTPSTFTVRKCNARLGGSGDPQTFSNGGCGAPIAGTLTVDNNRVRFKPNASSEADPTDFDHDFWYKVSVTNAIRDMASRTLLCPFETLDISLVGGNDDYCDRAVAFNDIRDVTPPTVAIGAPVSPPAYCASALIHTAQISATGNDDFLVAGIDFLLDGGAANLVNDVGDPQSNATNGAMANPYTADTVYVDLLPLAPGQHHVTAVAQDGVPQSSSTADSQFEVVPTHCCNNALDAADGETDIDCGGACHACNGASCTTGADCASGFCNPATHQCEERPFIQSVSPGSGGVGTLITLTGTGFGSAAGSVTFLGAAGDGDDVIAVACAPEAWTDTQVTVAVPAGSISGPLKLTTAGGPSDTTDDGFGPHLSDFSVGGPTAPGICYLSPSTGSPGSAFAANGAGFGATIGTSTAFMGATGATVTTCGAGETDCGWSDTKVWLTAPPIAENVYPVHLIINGVSTNNSNFLLRNSASSTAPHVTGVIPESGPVGSYVTVQGSGFGSLKGTVSLKFGAADVAIADDPACDDNWHDNYIIIKVPPQYQDTTPVNVSAGGVSHKVQVVTAPPARTSNDDITFKITNEAPRPGICSMTPDNGPPGNAVIVEGEGFGAGPGSPTANPRFAVQFFKTNVKHCLFSPFSACTNVGATCSNPAEGICVVNAVSSPGYSSWSGNNIGTVIAGETVKHCSIHTAVLCVDAGLACADPADGTCVADRSGWPATGPVYVVANNRLSTNAIPFTVQDCNEAGGHCPVGESCCANGSCQASCLPVARNSAYSWRFSTNVLPVLPRVVERAICSATTIPPVPQSPSPYKDSTDACKNAMLFFEFNRGLDKASFDNNSVKVEECGTGATPTCTGVIPLNPFSSPGTFASCDSLDPDLCKTFETRPANAYNGGTHYFKQNTWYRVTLTSNPGGSVGLKEPGATGRYLDGDDDGSQGGNYVYDFRVRDSADPCQVSTVYVDAPVATIQQDQDPVNFNAGLWGGNCNRLQCGPTEPYAIAWSKLGPYLSLMAPLNAACTQPAKGIQETSPGTPTPLTASVTPLDAAPPGGVPTGPVKDGHSDVTVKFADPRVIEVTPKAECVQACINAAIVATFNVPMDAATLNGSTVELKRCRNASCTAPFESTLGGATTASIQAIPEDGVSGAPPAILHKHVSIVLTGDMLPGTFYLARIKGGATGVKSRSGVQLAGLNDGQSFVWKFRTKDDPTACSVARTEVRPNRAVALYVGDRKTFTAIPYGSPDECSTGGQQLRATSYSWLWDFDAPTPNRVLRGFFSGSTTLPIYNHAAPGDLVDAKPIPKTGCSSNCLLTGSQNTVPQCGNGAVDSQYEECDDGNDVDNDACSNQCLLRGNVSPACGDHVVDATAGEVCDMIPDPATPGSFVWPNGCKQPGAHVEGFFDNIGCVFTGSSTAAGSVCGDHFQSDGEACDDGNTANGDGCSSNCLKEGTLRSCLDVGPNEPCVNFCGNGRVEPGEDPACEPAPGASGCDAQTCLKRGTAACSGGANCCGNGVDDLAAGEDPGCDTDPDRAEFCTDRCLYKGSSAYYTSPSFCADGIVGKGEKSTCEPSDYIGADHPKTDPYQAVSAAPQTGFDPSTAAGSTTTVKATVTGVPNEDAGRANVTLACNCKNEPPGSQDSYCQSIDPPATNDLACADNGCCTPRPTVRFVMPTIFNSCRNPQITVTFSELMNTGSISQHMLVGYNNGGAPCPAGSTALSFGGGSRTPGFWQKLWNGVLAFVRTFVLRPVFGSPPTAPSVAEQNETYCSVPGQITTISEGPPGSQNSKTYFNIVRALPANKYIRIQLDPGVKSAGGVPLTGNTGQAYRAYFGTGPTICTIDKVAVSPPSVLLASIDERQTVAALGLSASGQAIVPTLDYNWLWSWTLPAVPAPPAVPPAIVLEPRETNITSCTLGSVCTSGGGCSCTINGSTCTVANGAATCPVTALDIQGFADVRVRGSDPSDVMNGAAPHNSAAPEMIEALANLVNPSGAAFTISCTLGATCTAGGGCPCTVSATGCTVPNGQISCNAPTAAISSIVTSDTGRATVLLCKKPWPKYQTCTAGILDLPWVPGTNNGTCTADTWFPFYDELTNIEFYYCRDAPSTTGDVGNALPCLKEGPALVLNPGADILREYLFTFETNPAKCPSGPDAATGKWINDAVGLRFSTNTSHMSVSDWYSAKGFRGAPVKTKVNGYEALQEGRTAYVNTAAKLIPSGKLYTNVDVMSYSEGSQPETVAIFNQLLGFVNFNRNADLSNMGMCRKGELRASAAVKCNTSLDCQLNAAGLPVPGREGYICDAASGDCQRRQCVGGPNAGKDCNADTFCAPSTCGSPSPTPWAGRSIACDADVDCQVDAKGDAIPGRGLYKCDAPKSKLIRDVRRWSDLQSLRSQLVAKKNANGTFPTLDAGTFLRAQTNSRWPSWGAALGAPLGLSLPVDPLNRHAVCASPGYDHATCWNDKDRLYTCPVDSHVYEYRSVGGADFQIRNDFEYINVNGGTDIWSGSTCLEHNTNLADCVADPSGQCGGTCDDASVNRGSTCLTNSDCSGGSCLATSGKCNYREGKLFIGHGSSPFFGQMCAGATVGVGGVCGDGILSATETCEIGQVRAQSCDADMTGATRAGSYPQVCNNVCQWVNQGKCSANATNHGTSCLVDSQCTGTGAKCVTFVPFQCVGGSNPGTACAAPATCLGGGVCTSACVGGQCGDGVRQNPPEACDDGPLNGTYGHCNSNCTGSANSCGDGKKQPNESCDCKEKNGQYYFNGILSTGAEPGVSGPACGSGTTSVHSCAWDCQTAGPRCGDGVVNGTEICDGGFEEFKGYCNDTAQTGCNTSGQCPELGTCVSLHCSNDAAKSCATNDDCVKVCGNFCPTPEQKRRRECTPNNTGSAADDTNACNWGSWSCTSPGSCGNGIKETGEQCDDGNTNNNDACIIDVSKNYMCRSAQCGDGYVNPGSGEECDDGINNGRPCVPEYGLTCTYCSGACRTNTVSGGFCGDGLIQDSTWTPPPGPSQVEECDGATGLGPDWICVGTAQQYKSFGTYFGQALCSGTNCHRSCTSPDAGSCLNTVGTNSDSNDTCGAGTGPGCHLPGGGKKLYDICDPDDDNDGVPGDGLDCNDKDKNVHGAYHIEWDDDTGHHSYNIPAATEICNDIDEDCNGVKETHLVANGRIIDVQTGGKLAGAKVEFFCGPAKITEVPESAIPADGTWSIDYWFDNTLCTGQSTWSIRLNYSGELCQNGAPTTDLHQDFPYSVNSCLTAANVQWEVTKRPPPNMVRATIMWMADTDIDFHLFDSAGHNLNYASGNAGTGYIASITDGASVYTLDHDDQGGPGPNIETISVPRLSGRTYAFAAYSWASSADTWGQLGSFSGDGGGTYNGLKFRIYYDNCSEYHAEQRTYWNYTMGAVRNDFRWLGLMSATDVGGGDKYGFPCYPGTANSPCAGACTQGCTEGSSCNSGATGTASCVAPRHDCPAFDPSGTITGGCP